MSYSNDLRRRLYWLRFNYAVVLLTVLFVIAGLLLQDWNPKPPMRYATHQTNYARLLQAEVLEKNVLDGTQWIKSATGDMNVTFTVGKTIDSRIVYRLSTQSKGIEQQSGGFESGSVTVSPNTGYVYRDYYSSNLANFVEIDELDAAGSLVLRSRLQSMPPAENEGHYSGGFVTGSRTVRIVVRRALADTGRLDVESPRLARSNATSFGEGFVTIALENTANLSYDALGVVRDFEYTPTYYVDPSTIGGTGQFTLSQLIGLQTSGIKVGLEFDVSQLPIDPADRVERIGRVRADLEDQGLSPSLATIAGANVSGSDAQTLSRYYSSTLLNGVQAVNYPYNYSPHGVHGYMVNSTISSEQIYSLIERVKRSGGWLVLVYSGANQAISEEELRKQLDYVRLSGMSVFSMPQALERVETFIQESVR